MWMLNNCNALWDVIKWIGDEYKEQNSWISALISERSLVLDKTFSISSFTESSRLKCWTWPDQHKRNILSLWPLAVCGGVEGSAGRGWRALIRHAQDLQALPLRPAAAMTGQHGRVHTFTGRIWAHTHTHTHHTSRSDKTHHITVYITDVTVALFRQR